VAVADDVSLAVEDGVAESADPPSEGGGVPVAEEEEDAEEETVELVVCV